MNDRFSPLSRLFFLFFAITASAVRTQAQSPLDSLPPMDSLNDWQVNQWTQQLATQARLFELDLSQKQVASVVHRSAAEDLWQAAKADSTIAKTVVDSLASLLKKARGEEKNATKNWEQVKKALDLAASSENADNVTQRKNLPKLWKSLRSVAASMQPPVEKVPKVKTPKEKKKPKEKEQTAPELPAIADSSAVQTMPVKTEKKKENTPPPGPKYRKYDPSRDVTLNPPALPCRMAVATRDEFSGEIYRRCVGIELFRSAPPALRNFLQGKANVLCAAALGASGSRYFLQLRFTIHDPNPRKAFGRLEKDSPAFLTLMDGSTIQLNNQQLSEGVLNPDTGAFVYEAQYPLIADEMKKLRRMELDKIRIAWSSGYEDYDVQYVQLLMQQARCLLEGGEGQH